jgi:hypothetical protein
MSESESMALARASKNGRIALRGTATGCGRIHARVARAIWPSKTAHHWAAAAGRKTRIAEYWLAGREVDEAGKLAIIRQLD